MAEKSNMWQKIKLIAFAAGIPALLAVQGIQARHYALCESEVRQLEKKQLQLIEENKQLVSDISMLGNSERIEKIAVEELGMRPADSSEIIRVKVK